MIHVFVAMLLFTVFAIGGLIADLGFVRLAQRQINNAADAASIEGMRLQDSMDDVDRRAAANEVLRAHFDDDFNVTPDDPYQFGAGPLVTVDDGVGAIDANAKVNVDPQIVYKPDLELNLLNIEHGDMVSGFFDEADVAHQEASDYSRSDFSTVQADPAWREAFLVRVRRTGNPAGLDAQSGISSSGPPLPYLFARGSLMAEGMRKRGVNLRTSVIAVGRTTTTAGRPQPALGFVGYGPLALDYELWQAFQAGDQFVLAVGNSLTTGSRGRGQNGQPDANPFPYGPPIIPPGQVNPIPTTRPNWAFLEEPDQIGILSLGRGLPVDDDLIENTDLNRVRQILAAYGIDASDLDEDGDTLSVNMTFFATVYFGDVLVPTWDGIPGKKWDNVDPEGLAPRVVGFGAIEIVEIRFFDPDDDDDDNGNGNGNGGPRIEVVIRKLPSVVWSRNVSAVETPGLAGVSADEAEDLVRRNKSLNEPARAAALAR